MPPESWPTTALYRGSKTLEPFCYPNVLPCHIKMVVSFFAVATQPGWTANSGITGSTWQFRMSLYSGADNADSNIHRVEYHQVLLDEAKRLGAKIHLDCEVASVNTTTPSVRLSSGKAYTGDVVVGADGKPRPIDVIVYF
jgi:hypothetical protein